MWCKVENYTNFQTMHVNESLMFGTLAVVNKVALASDPSRPPPWLRAAPARRPRLRVTHTYILLHARTSTYLRYLTCFPYTTYSGALKYFSSWSFISWPSKCNAQTYTTILLWLTFQLHKSTLKIKIVYSYIGTYIGIKSSVP